MRCHTFAWLRELETLLWRVLFRHRRALLDLQRARHNSADQTPHINMPSADEQDGQAATPWPPAHEWGRARSGQVQAHAGPWADPTLVEHERKLA